MVILDIINSVCKLDEIYAVHSYWCGRELEKNYCGCHVALKGDGNM